MAVWQPGFLLATVRAGTVEKSEIHPFKASKQAADQCRSKIEKLQDFSPERNPGERQMLRFSEEEINSYLALELSNKYHPSLRGLQIVFKENELQAIAAIDFDRLGSTSTGALTRMISLMFSGVHTISAIGRLISGSGSAYFDLKEARFDDSTLPKTLVEEIITAVGQRQNPPFDPLRPSKLPYKIDKIDVHSGYIIVYQ